MKKIYITGICGMLGSNIAMYLKDKYFVSGCDLYPHHFETLHFDKLNMADTSTLQQSIIDNSPDIVIHTAAMINVDACEEEKQQAQIMNSEVTNNLAKICAEQHIKLIYISTDAVFDGTKKELYSEEDTTTPLNIYGITKLAGESSVLQQKENVVLRTNIYGYNYQEKKSFGEWILYSLLDGEELKMFDDIYFSPILVNDLANLIDRILANNICGLYHACGTGSISKYEFGCKLKEVFQIESGSIFQTQSDTFSFKAKRAKNMGMSNKKLSNMLGIVIRSPEESIIEFKRLYDENYHLKLKNL